MAKFNIELTILGTTHKSSGVDLKEALDNIKLEWNEIKGKGSMLIKSGKKTYEQLFSMVVLRRIVHDKLARVLWAKNLMVFFK